MTEIDDMLFWTKNATSNTSWFESQYPSKPRGNDLRTHFLDSLHSVKVSTFELLLLDTLMLSCQKFRTAFFS